MRCVPVPPIFVAPKKVKLWSLTPSFPGTSLVRYLQKSVYLGPKTFVLANQKTISPRNMSSILILSFSWSDIGCQRRLCPCANDMPCLKHPAWGAPGTAFAEKCVSRPTNLRFGQFKDCITWKSIFHNHSEL